MTREDLEGFAGRLKEFIKTDIAQEVFLWYTGSQKWDEGGCYALAQAASELLAAHGVQAIEVGMGYFDLISGDRIIAHVVMEIPGLELYLDANGLHSWKEKTAMYPNTAYLIRKTKLRSGDLDHLYHSPDFITDLRYALDQFLKNEQSDRNKIRPEMPQM